MKLLLAVSVAVLAATSAAEHHHHHHHKSHHHHHKHLHHMKFREVDVVGPREQCPRGGSVVLCSSLTDECQDDAAKPGQQVCQPRDGATLLAKIDAKTTGPWNQCSFLDAALPSKCLFGFECLCNDVENKKCKCSPPDTFRIGRGLPPSNCSTSDGKVGCDAGKYCRTKGSKQECAPAPYLPGLGLYAQCSGVYKSPCQDGLTCKQFGTDYSICVKQ